MLSEVNQQFNYLPQASQIVTSSDLKFSKNVYALTQETPKLTSSMQILLALETLNSGGIGEYQD